MGKDNKKSANNRKEIERKSAKAPYNFVQLPHKIVPAPDLKDEFFGRFYDYDKCGRKRYTGYIDLSIKTLTPLYIRREKDESDFFRAGNSVRIPGSSLRGMTRTLLEIVSYSRFKFYDDQRFFYRAVADTSALGKAYRNFFVGEDGIYKFKAGLLKEKKGKYFIYPSKTLKGTQIYRVENELISKKLADFDRYRDVYRIEKVCFKPAEIREHKHSNNTRLNYAKIDCFCEESKKELCPVKSDAKCCVMGYLIITGPLGKKKHMQWVINEEDGNIKKEVPKEVIENYRQDKNRGEGYDVLAKLAEEGKVPVFYLCDEKGEVVYIGHTGFFRINYRYTVSDHIPEYVLDNNDVAIDFAEAIFGKESKFASRVFFEDAEIVGEEDAFLPETSPKRLALPKPTAFQHYLEQPCGAKTSKKDLKTWNDKNAFIRGYKLYWHRKVPDFPEGKLGEYSWNTGEKRYGNGDTIIKPIKSGKCFKGRIRFENLLEEELGALLFVLDLPEGCAHKLGMGKPLGLGSVSIKPELFLIDRKKRYKKLFENGRWNLGEEKADIKDMEKFKKAFENYILQHIDSEVDSEAISKLWDIERLKQLKLMLSFKSFNSSEKGLENTRYMLIGCRGNKCLVDGNEFKERFVLPKPDEVFEEK